MHVKLGIVRTLKRIYSCRCEIQDALFEVRDIIFFFELAVGRMLSCDRLVVKTLRCGRSNPGLNRGLSMSFVNSFYLFFFGEGVKIF